MNARDELRVMALSLATGTAVVEPKAFDAALERYRNAVILKAVGRLRAFPVQCTALTGPVWYGTGWNEAITQLEEIADYQAPDDEAYPGELELLRALAMNVRLRARQGDLAFVQQLVEQHYQADKEGRLKAQGRTS
ncbi:hypothetical protein [Streptomyces achromogenes]|uniref:hypothetical protein n=1 Tax=Streptomyces achromogenes TaxID=67255 RepID=UPI003A802A1D